MNALKRTDYSFITNLLTDKKNGSIMNLHENCELGTSFLKSIDAYFNSHIVEYIKKVREGSVLQIVTNNVAVNSPAKRLMKEERPHVLVFMCSPHY